MDAAHLERLIYRRGSLCNIMGRDGPTTTDYESGTVSRSTKTPRPFRALVLDASAFAELEEDLTYVASNRQYSFGGSFDVQAIKIITLTKFLGPQDLEIESVVYARSQFYRVQKINQSGDVTTMLAIRSASAEGRVFTMQLGSHIPLDSACRV